MRFSDTITPPCGAMAPPISPVPEPRGTIGTRAAPTQPHDRLHLLGARRQHDRVGRALVEGVHVALVHHPPFGGEHEPSARRCAQLRTIARSQGHTSTECPRTRREHDSAWHA